MAMDGGGSGGGGGTGAWRLEGEGGKAKLGECGGGGGGGTIGAWDATGLGGTGVSTGGKHGEIILGSKVWAGKESEGFSKTGGLRDRDSEGFRVESWNWEAEQWY